MACLCIENVTRAQNSKTAVCNCDRLHVCATPIYRSGKLSQALRSLPDGIGTTTLKLGRVLMKKFWPGVALLGILSATPAYAWDRGDVDVLAVLPDVTPGVPSSVEGLTVGPDDNIYVTSFGFNATGAISGNSVLLRHQTERQSGSESAPSPIPALTRLGLAFNPVNGFLLVLDFGAGKVLHVDPVTGTSSGLHRPQ